MMPLIECVSTITHDIASTGLTTSEATNAVLTKLATKYVWFADDSAGGGTIPNLEKWWSNLKDSGPSFGYSQSNRPKST